MTNNTSTKIQMTAYDTTVTYELPYSDVTINEMIHGIVSCLYGLTWTEDVIISGMKEFIEEREEE